MFIKVTNDKSSKSLIDNINRGNIIVLYYANWCGHCVSFKPEWHKLVNKLKKNHDMRSFNIGEIEHSHLETFPEKTVQAFPSIKLYKFNKDYIKHKQNNLASLHKTNKLKSHKNVRSLKRKKHLKKEKLTLKHKNNKKNNLFKNLFNSMNLIYNRNQIDKKPKTETLENNNELNNTDDSNSNNNPNNPNNNSISSKIINHNVVDYDFGQDRSVHKLLEFIRQHAEKDSTVNKYENNNNLYNKVKKVKSPTNKVKKVKSPTNKIKKVKSSTIKVKKIKSPTDKVKKVKSPTNKVKKVKSPTDKVKKVKSPTDKVKKKMSKRYHKLKDKDEEIGNKILNSFNMPSMS